VQDQKSLDLLIDRSCPATLAGDTRIDSVIQLQHQLKEYPLLKRIINNRQVLIFGSIWPEDLLIIQSWINDHLSHPQFCFLLAPHEVSETMIEKIKSAIHTPAVRFSQLENGTQEESVIIIDTIGDLAHLYPLADVGYVGGGFGKSIHSILEPAAAKVPVIFGPKHRKFKEAAELMACGGAISIENEIKFSAAMQYFLDAKNRIEADQGILGFLDRHQGATYLIVNYLVTHKLIK
jgi:3-deoxy-D-manno-octulosonic-acid transferase